jgi:iron complex outermembrane receptor protein
MKRTIIAALCIGAASTAFAQEDAVVVTATRFPERRLDAPIGMTIITADEIARDTASNLPELLSRLGGMGARNNTGSPDQQIDLRGFGVTGDQNTLVLLDGIRINENDLSSTKFSSIPLQSIERIEILRGSGSVLYGDGASGGTINIITRGPQPKRSGSVFGGVGSYSTLDVRANVNLPGEHGGGAALSAAHLESDNYRVNNRLREDNMAGDLRLTEGAGKWGLKFGAETQRLQMPGARTEAQLISDPRGATTPSDWSSRESGFATLSFGRPIGASDVTADLGHREKESTFYSFGSYQRIWTRNTAFSPRVRVPFAAFGMEHVLIAGIDWVDWDYDSRFASSLDGFGTPGTGTSGTQQNSGAYLQYNGQLAARTKLTLGAREQRVADDRVAFGTEQSQVQKPHAEEAALSQGFAEDWQVYGKVGTSFRVANVDENGFTATGNLLKAQTGRNKEAGIEYRQRGLSLRASVYRIDLENEIAFSPFTVPVGSIFAGANTNLSPTRRDGVELFASQRFSPAFDLSGNLILQKGTFRSGVYNGTDLSGREVPLVPETLANLRASWQFVPDTFLIGAVNYVGKQRYDNDQANLFHDMPTYTIMDLKLSHRRGRATMSLIVNNVFDKAYYSYGIVNSPTAPTTFNAYPERRRNLMATIEVAI